MDRKDIEREHEDMEHDELERLISEEMIDELIRRRERDKEYGGRAQIGFNASFVVLSSIFTSLIFIVFVTSLIEVLFSIDYTSFVDNDAFVVFVSAIMAYFIAPFYFDRAA